MSPSKNNGGSKRGGQSAPKRGTQQVSIVGMTLKEEGEGRSHVVIGRGSKTKIRSNI